MAKSSARPGRRKTLSFVALQHRILEHENFVALSPKAVKLLLDVCVQYRGNNNGDLCATWGQMKARGWRSKGTLAKALQELLHYGFLSLTRQGGKHQCSLYALTWESIDDCKGKLEIPAAPVASNDWMQSRQKFTPRRERRTETVPRSTGQCAPIIGSIKEKRHANPTE